MKHLWLVLVVGFFSACAGTPHERPDPIEDFVVVNELESVSSIRTYGTGQLQHARLNDSYLILESRREYYLLEYRTPCRDFSNDIVRPDIRRDANTISAGVDTYRGCVIGAFYPIDEGQAEELKQLAKK
jgi:hypothetical protein